MSIVLGVDGGNSKTHAVILSERGQVMGFGRAGCGNHQRFGLPLALEEIKKSIDAALVDGNLTPKQIDFICYCLAGADLEEDFALLRLAMTDLGFPSKFSLYNDTFAALRAGLCKHWGLVVVCGAGFNAAVKTEDGIEYTMPGLGEISGDWAGGSALGMEMIRLIMRAWDGRGKPTLLTQFILQYFNAEDEPTLMVRLYRNQISRERILNVVPVLFQAAEAGDQVSKDLIEKLAVEVAITALALIRRFNLEEKAVEVVLGGSVFKGEGDFLIDAVRKMVNAESPQAQIKRTRFEPVVGAGLLALEHVGVSINQEILQRLEDSFCNESNIPRQGFRG